MNRLVPAALAALCFAAPSLARDREAVPEATPIGKPVSCLTLNQVRETRVHGDSVIDFHTNGNKVYRNTLPISCPMLGFEERFSVQDLDEPDLLGRHHHGARIARAHAGALMRARPVPAGGIGQSCENAALGLAAACPLC